MVYAAKSSKVKIKELWVCVGCNHNSSKLCDKQLFWFNNNTCPAITTPTYQVVQKYIQLSVLHKNGHKHVTLVYCKLVCLHMPIR